MRAPRALIDLAAIRHNTAVVAAEVAPAEVIAIVKAEGYGHGAASVARAALAGGAQRIGTATLTEAFALRAAGITAPVLAWLHTPDADIARAVAERITIGVSDATILAAVDAAARAQSVRATVHLELDTGMRRGGAAPHLWAALAAQAADAEVRGTLTVEGVFSHLQSADDPADPSTERQRRVFEHGVEVLRGAGLRPVLRHLANSAGAILHPQTRFDAVRPGIALYGLSASPAITLPLRAALELRAPIARLVPVSPGDRVSYGGTWTATRSSTLALLAIGYADGVPRALSGRIAARHGERHLPSVGRICMDQMLVDLGTSTHGLVPGDEVTLFTSAEEWAEPLGTIGYEVVSGLRGRIVREYIDSDLAS